MFQPRNLVAACLLALAGSASAAPVDHATLVSSDGRDVYDFELKRLIDIFIGPTAGTDYESLILAFTQCFGADAFDDFAGNGATSMVSGSSPGNTSEYGGYHRALAGALRPGRTVAQAHADGVAGSLAGDSPVIGGANNVIGGTSSTHVLVWAGDPNNLDRDDIADIRDNFGGHPGATVTVLAGDGTGADAPATFEALVEALGDIGAQMSATEQFVMFVTDHGNLDSGFDDVLLEAGLPVDLDIPLTAFGPMLADPLNVPQLALFSSTQIDPSAMDSIVLNQLELLGVHSFFDVFVEIDIDYDDDGLADAWQYVATLQESMLSQLNHIAFGYSGSGPLLLDLVSIESGAIARTTGVDEPPGWLLFLAGALLVVGRVTPPPRPRVASGG